MQVMLKNKTAKRIKQNPLLSAEDLVKVPAELPKSWVEFIDPKSNYIGSGYLGEQNKGIGWLISYNKEKLDSNFFQKLFKKAIETRYVFFQDDGTTAFRLFNGEGDGLGGLTIDYYAGYLVFSWYNKTIFTQKELLIAALREVMPEIKGASEKLRFKGAEGESTWLFGEQPLEPLIVKENGINYAVYLDDGLMTGIFLDQKEVRGTLSEGFAAGKKVLNMFSYTGAFSVASAFGGALETTSVDLAKRSLPKTKEQFDVNQLSLENNRIVVMDTFEYFRYAQRKGFTFDLIILDPPSFARNKKKTFSVQKNYGELIKDSLSILADNGQIIASTNAANLSKKKFKESIEAVLVEAGVTFKQLNEFGLPADFPKISGLAESDYLKVLFYQIHK